MSERKVVFVGFFNEAWEEILEFLKEKDFKDENYIKHLEEVLHGSKK